jgi:hypothetical protein
MDLRARHGGGAGAYGAHGAHGAHGAGLSHGVSGARSPARGDMEAMGGSVHGGHGALRLRISWECDGKMLGICWEYLGIIHYPLVI